MRPSQPAAAVLSGALVTLLAAACAQGPADATPGRTATAAPSRPAATTPRTPGTPSATATPPSTPRPAPIPADPAVLTLAFGGDVHFEDYLRPLATDPHALDELQGTLGAADLSMVNLETAITGRGTEIGKEFHFRAPPSALVTLRNAGVDAVSMANNHGADFGKVGLADTLAAKRASPIPIVGIGATGAEAFAPATLTAKGLKVAVFGASQVHEMTLLNWSAVADSPGIASAAPATRLKTAVRKAAATHDVVVVFMHWGLDYQKCPDGESQSTASALEQAGADVIVGGHSHRVNAAGWMRRAYVGYGLGNFVWWRDHEPDSRTGVLTLGLDVAAAKRAGSRDSALVRRAVWTAMLIGSDGIPRVPAASDERRLRGLWEQSRGCSGLESRP